MTKGMLGVGGFLRKTWASGMIVAGRLRHRAKDITHDEILKPSKNTHFTLSRSEPDAFSGGCEVEM